MTLTNSQTLGFLCKANKIGVVTTVVESPGKAGHLIHMDYDWLLPGSISRETVYIPNDGDPDWRIAQNEGATIDYTIAEALFEAKILQQGREVYREQRRKVVLSHLSDEERELLGI